MGEVHKHVLERTELGRYVWWPALQIIDFIPKGRSNAAQTFLLDGRTGTDEAAARAKIERIEKQRARGSG